MKPCYEMVRTVWYDITLFVRHQAIYWTNADLILIGPLGIDSIEI